MVHKLNFHGFFAGLFRALTYIFQKGQYISINLRNSMLAIQSQLQLKIEIYYIIPWRLLPHYQLWRITKQQIIRPVASNSLIQILRQQCDLPSSYIQQVMATHASFSSYFDFREMRKTIVFEFPKKKQKIRNCKIRKYQS